MNNKLIIPRTLKKLMNLFVLSKDLEGKRMPMNEASPTAIPKYPIGMPSMCEINENAELSQLKKVEKSQNEPA
jgi:hypothetical protein